MPARQTSLAFWVLSVVLLLAMPALAYAEDDPVPGAFIVRQDVNKPGGDIDSFDLGARAKFQCARACYDSSFCLAYTWVRPSTPGGQGKCWLKGTVTESKASDCCETGVKKEKFADYAGTVEADTDLPGSDAESSILPMPDVELCKRACARNADCAAFTYVRPGLQGPNAVCYLKDTVPERKTGKTCCISGIKASALVTFAVSEDTDRPGLNYHHFDVPTGGRDVCQRACEADADCKVYTYVKSAAGRPTGTCWLKSGYPDAKPSQCCDSAFKRTGRAELNTAKVGTDIPGHDYHRFTVETLFGKTAERASICADACGADGKCRAYTYVNPGVQGPQAVCYLKDDVSASTNDACCTSATRKPEFIVKPLPPGHTPPVLYFSQNNPLRQFAGIPVPDDMPDVRFPVGFKGCSGRDSILIKRGWVLAHHNLWRAQQVMQFIKARTRERDDLWVYGFNDRMKDATGDFSNIGPRGWFGSYEARRFRLARRAIDKVWNDRFLGRTFEVQCRQPDSDGAHPCQTLFKIDPDANHIVLGKINFCTDFFQSASTDVLRAQTIVHEMFHWLKIPKSGYWVSDRHDFWKSCRDYEAVRALYGSDAAFLGMNRGCKDWNHNRAVLTNDNYAWFATMLGSRVYLGAIRSFPGEDFR